MKRLLNPLFVFSVIALAVGNEFVLRFLFSFDGELDESAKLVIRLVNAAITVVALCSPRFWPALSSWMIGTFRRRPNAAAIATGIALLFLLAVTTELGFRAFLVRQTRHHPEPVLIRSVPSSQLYEPNGVVREQRVDGDHIIYDYVYTLDEKGLRVTPAAPRAPTGHDLVFFGGSFTFGVGVSDDETLPNRVAARAPRWGVTNFGAGGFGPAHMLRAIEAENVAEYFRGGQSHVLYVYIPHHVRRVIGGMRTATGFGHDFPYYVIAPDGSLEYRGTMTSGRPWLQRFYSALDRESLLQFFDIDIPVRITERHLDLTARIIAESRDRWFDALPGSSFTVVIYPEPTWSESPAEEIIPMLNARGIQVLDYSDRFDDQPEMWIPGDLHPTAEAHDRVAEWITSDLHLADYRLTD